MRKINSERHLRTTVDLYKASLVYCADTDTDQNTNI